MKILGALRTEARALIIRRTDTLDAAAESAGQQGRLVSMPRLGELSEFYRGFR